MLVEGNHYRTIWPNKGLSGVTIIDQTFLPFEFKLRQLSTLDEAVEAIKSMRVRGAPLIGVTAAYGIAISLTENQSDESLIAAKKILIESRPTAVNLSWAVNLVYDKLKKEPEVSRVSMAWKLANRLADEDVKINQSIGNFGLKLIKGIKKSRINVLTHCNAGWLATIDHGTALSPIYKAFEDGIDIHVWVDETRPRNQGMNLTAWELGQANIPHTIITDNAGGLLMQRGEVDFVIVGADRVSVDGNVCNKIGTYLKALAAKTHKIPFYVAAPLSSVDLSYHGENNLFDIECRDESEILRVKGMDSLNNLTEVQIGYSSAYNPAFDITPSKYISKIICEKGIYNPGDIGKALK
ncbi:S-methyl-5-thioribose-1-phosphate isomerase [Methylophilaceae bacterium]|jgi:methylthioribose-1-phosphate isomerase|nr:S-methyl-5-thioribose-1-phosphate isomerase [Methylophilaceae bacterium]